MPKVIFVSADKGEEKETEAQQDMLDLVYGLRPTSRLGCQILITDKLEGLKVRLPAETLDLRG